MLKMYAELDGRLNGLDFKKYNEGISFGSFRFACEINGESKSVNIDWDSFVGHVQDNGNLLLAMGEDAYIRGTQEPSDVFDEQYLLDGYSRKDLTAKLLASVTEIEQFSIDYDAEEKLSDDDFLHIVSLTFVDETGSYSVSGEVLDRFNELEPYESVRAEGDLGEYDVFDGNYPDESDSATLPDDEYDEFEELPF